MLQLTDVHISPSPARAARAMDKVSFGHEDVSPEEKTRRVGAVFSSVAAATI